MKWLPNMVVTSMWWSSSISKHGDSCQLYSSNAKAELKATLASCPVTLQWQHPSQIDEPWRKFLRKGAAIDVDKATTHQSNVKQVVGFVPAKGLGVMVVASKEGHGNETFWGVACILFSDKNDLIPDSHVSSDLPSISICTLRDDHPEIRNMLLPILVSEAESRGIQGLQYSCRNDDPVGLELCSRLGFRRAPWAHGEHRGWATGHPVAVPLVKVFGPATEIRPAIIARDLPTILALWQETSAMEGSEATIAELESALLLNSARSGDVLLAQQESNVVGVAVYDLKTYQGRPILCINHLFVAPSAGQGRVGASMRLIQYLQEMAKTKNCTNLVTSSTFGGLLGLMEIVIDDDIIDEHFFRTIQ